MTLEATKWSQSHLKTCLSLAKNGKWIQCNPGLGSGKRMPQSSDLLHSDENCQCFSIFEKLVQGCDGSNYSSSCIQVNDIVVMPCHFKFHLKSRSAEAHFTF